MSRYVKYWLAIGGLSYLSAQRLEGVKELDIVLYPDLGGFDKWAAKAAEFKADGFNVAVSEILERNESNKSKGFDLADYFIKNLMSFDVRVAT